MSPRSPGLRRRVELAVPAKRAFASVGTLAGVRGWWTPLTSGVIRQGGELRLRFRGLDETIRFRVEACDAPRSARWLCLGHDALEDWAGTRLSFSFMAAGPSATSLELVHEGLVPSLACYRACRAGWDHFLGSLAAWVETGRGEPFGGGSRAAQGAPDEQAYARLVRAFVRDPRVTTPEEPNGRFGTNGLRVDGKIFAMWVRGALVVKLPRKDVDHAVATQAGVRLEMGRGRVMREWLVVGEPERHWKSIAERARRYVGGA